jgi:pimeloyl-ACP methyl ester carboxylesterase
MGRMIYGVLLFDISFPGRAADQKIENVNRVVQLLRRLVRRMIFLPVLLALVIAVLVYFGTHPEPAPSLVDPIVQGIYYDPLTYQSPDHIRLEAWLVPFVDAKRVLADKENALREKRPAVVLVHDFAWSRQQMLPLMRPLHNAGFVVLAVSLRGCGESAPAACTFGLNESQDVEASVEMLRRRPFVDPERIGVIGIGTGANACILAADRDASLRALVLDHPLHNFDEAVARHIGPDQPRLRWMHSLCKWGFEISYGLDGEEISVERLSREFQTRPVLLFDADNPGCLDPRKITQVVDFLRQSLAEPAEAANASVEEP